MKSELFDGYGTGKINAWWFRWAADVPAGRWLVCAIWGVGLHQLMQPAVVDDFGNLVGVPA